jgi:hypothetical protein
MVILGLAVLGLGGCGGGDDDSAGTTTTVASGGGVPAPGGGLTVADALDSDAQSKLLVRGYVVASGDEVKLCESLEGTPPTCGGASAELDGYDVAALDGSSGSTKWSKSEVKVLVDRDGDVFRASSTSR